MKDNELAPAADEKVLARRAHVTAKSISSETLIGHMELDRRRAESPFEDSIERDAKNTVAIASNDSLRSRSTTFTDPRLRAAIVDRLTLCDNVIEPKAGSSRLAHARAAT